MIKIELIFNNFRKMFMLNKNFLFIFKLILILNLGFRAHSSVLDQSEFENELSDESLKLFLSDISSSRGADFDKIFKSVPKDEQEETADAIKAISPEAISFQLGMN